MSAQREAAEHVNAALACCVFAELRRLGYAVASHGGSGATQHNLPNLPELRPRVIRGTLVRPMSPAGYYWSETFRSPGALYSSAPDLVFTACHFDESLNEGDYYSEFDDPMLEEVRLFAALALPIKWDGGTVSLFPHTREYRLPGMFDLASLDVEASLRSFLINKGKDLGSPVKTDPPPPPCWGGPQYEFREAPMPAALQLRLLNAMDDQLLLRGLSAWFESRDASKLPTIWVGSALLDVRGARSIFLSRLSTTERAGHSKS